MTVFELVRLIADNSFMAIATAIMLWIFIRNEKNRNRKEKLAEEQKIRDNEAREKQYNMVLEKLFEKFDSCTEQKNNHSSVEEDLIQEKINHQIDEFLENLRESTKASRVFLVKYHNGMYDLVGNPSAKMSITNEKDSPGIVPSMSLFRDQFRSLFGEWCKELRENKKCFIPNIEIFSEEKNHPPSLEFLLSRGIKGIFGYGVYDNNQNIIGFIGLEYLENFEKYGIEIEKIESCLRDKSNKISALLNFK